MRHFYLFISTINEVLYYNPRKRAFTLVFSHQHHHRPSNGHSTSTSTLKMSIHTRFKVIRSSVDIPRYLFFFCSTVTNYCQGSSQPSFLWHNNPWKRARMLVFEGISLPHHHCLSNCHQPAPSKRAWKRARILHLRSFWGYLPITITTVPQLQYLSFLS